MKTLIALAVGLAACTALPAAEAQAAPVFCSLRWCQPVYYTVGTNPTGVALGDFDGDRATDMAVAVQGSDKISILRNSRRGGELGPPLDIPLTAGSAPHSVVAIDVDNDMDLDLVVTRSSMNDVQILANTGGVFSLGATTVVGGTLPSDIAVGDLDGNGFADIVTSNRGSANVSVMLNSAGALAGGVPYSVGSGPRGLALSDLDGEGSLDLAAASIDTGAVDILLNDGDGVLGYESSLPVGPGLNPNGDVVAGDFDDNGHSDIALVTTGSAGDFATLFLNTGSASFKSPAHFKSDGNYPTSDFGDPTSLVAVDFDLDETLDLALTNLGSSTMANLLGDGSGLFTFPYLVPDKTGPGAIAAADLDGDGANDLATANSESANVGVMINTYVIFTDGFEWGDTEAWSGHKP